MKTSKPTERVMETSLRKRRGVVRASVRSFVLENSIYLMMLCTSLFMYAPEACYKILIAGAWLKVLGKFLSVKIAIGEDDLVVLHIIVP